MTTGLSQQSPVQKPNVDKQSTIFTQLCTAIIFTTQVSAPHALFLEERTLSEKNSCKGQCYITQDGQSQGRKVARAHQEYEVRCMDGEYRDEDYVL